MWRPIWRGEMLTETTGPSAPPSGGVGAGVGEHPIGKRLDEAGFFGQGDELAGADEAALGVLPAHERLEGDEIVAVQAHDRLVVQA